MSKKSKKMQEDSNRDYPIQPVRPRVTFRVMNNCGVVPVAKPADFIQLTPVVQPISLIPYSTQEQPMAEFDEEGGEYEEY